jgi:alkanesulfonate monooxygenase SsuD/methylene tetrahydromethanopterin reductase-like flavin-dependent oxidoreductase (luciferase family)
MTNPFYRSANLLAASIATLQRASSGRAFLGLGRGEPDWYRTAFGMEIGSPLNRVRQTIDVLRQWWGDDQRASNEGEFVVRNWKRSFHPGTVPPIYLAATGQKMFALAGEMADGVRLNTLASLSLFQDGVSVMSQAATEAGHDPGKLRVFADPGVTITDSDEQQRRAINRAKGTMSLIHVLPGMNRQLLGLDAKYDLERILADVRKVMHTDEVLKRGGSFSDLRAAGDLRAARSMIPDDLVLEVAAIGSWPVVRDRLIALAGAGVTDILVDVDQVHDPEIRREIAAI